MKLQLRKLTARLVLLFLLLSYSLVTYAQSDPTGKSVATNTFAVTNATIITSPNDTLKAGTLVIKNGLISAIGSNASIPDDAEIIDGTDMFVYPGFIDGMSHAGAKKPKDIERPDNLFSPDPPNDYAGITPEHSVLSQIDIKEKSIADMRKLGFTISHTVPHGRMLPGSGSLILLSEKDHVDDLLLAESVSMFTQFVGAPRAYPGNTLGIMAKWRNLYRNAEYSKAYTEMYAKNPAGLERPVQDRVLQAYYPVIDKKTPVFYKTNTALEARRSMRLQSDLDFDLVLGNLEQSWDLKNDIKKHNAKVFMSLELPKEAKNDKSKNKSEETKALEARRMEFYDLHLKQYEELDKAGISFGFSTMGTKANKVKDNIATLIAHGLNEKTALAALTINAAILLGIDDITGTLETGKLANVLVSLGPYFDKKSQVRYVFVDGDKYEYEAKKPEKEGEGSDVPVEGMDSVIGSWSYTSTSPQGERTGKMIFEEDGDEITGVFKNDDGRPDQILSNISFVDGNLSFDFSFDAGGQSVEVVVEGDVSGTDFDGEAYIDAFNFSFPLSATKDEPEN